MKRRYNKLKLRYILPISFFIMMSAVDVTYGAPMVCSFVGLNSGTISFPTLDLSTVGPVYGTVTSNVQFTCSKNIAYTITSCPASITGSGFSTAASIPVGISILQTAYQNAKAGAHSDTITVTVTY